MPRLAQPFGSTSIEVNKQSIARYFGVKQSEVIYFAAGVDLGGYKVIYDKAQQRAYSLPAGISAGTTATSLSSAGVLVHSAGSEDLGVLAVSREEFVTLPGTFSTGATINTHNELLTHDGLQYRWEGTLPKVVPANSTPVTSGGIGSNAWLYTGVLGLKQQLASDAAVLGDFLVATEQPFSGAKLQTVHSKLAQVISVLDFDGVVGDGVNDDTAGIQAAVNATPWGGTLIVPTPKSMYKISSAITINKPIKIVGDGGSTSPVTASGCSSFNARWLSSRRKSACWSFPAGTAFPTIACRRPRLSWRDG